MLMNSIHKIVATCVACVGATFAAPAIWNGTADVSWYESSAQAYNLTTAEQLAGLAKLVNQGTSSFEGKTITLGMDIYLNDTTGAGSGTWASIPRTQWTPIGTSSRPFKGEFDGLAGKKVRKIYGLYINNASKDYAGLFGNTRNVKISNLDVLVGQITAHDNVGGLVGYATGGSITNVHAEIKVTGNNHTGGLAGYTTGTISASSVKENVVGRDSVGGLVGVTTTAILGTSKGNSYFIGNVAGRKYVGGLAGSGESISKCYVEGSVTGDSSYVGGVIGYASGTIDSTYHIGGDVSGFGYVGGLAGYVTVAGSVSYSHAEGKITALGSYVGGVVGYSRGSIDSVYHKNGDVTGSKYYVGGLVGYGFTVSKGYAIGVVKGDSYVGGVAGYVKQISTSQYVGDVGGYSYVGGLAGEMDSTLSTSQFYGNVLAKGDYVGGLIGLSYRNSIRGSLSFSSQNSSVSGRIKGNNYVGGLIGLDSVSASSSFPITRRVGSSHVRGDVEGNMYVGGVVGKFSGVDNEYALAIVESSSHARGNVIGRSNYVGGITGAMRGVIKSSKHYEGDVSGFNYVGGLAGVVDSTVDDSYSDGNVTGTGDYVGGLIGYSLYRYRSSSSVNVMTLSNSYSKGNIRGKNFVGGLIGKDSTYRGVSNAYSVRRNIKKSYALGNVEGNMYVGGIVGKSNQGAGSSTYNVNFADSIILSYHKDGSVIGQNDYIGGVAGYVANTSIDSCYHEGGNVSGRSYVAGLAGYTDKVVKNSHSKADVVGTAHYVGGLVGYGSTISDSYVNGMVRGDSSYVGGVAGGVTGIVKSVYHIGGDVRGFDNVGGVVGLALRQVNTSDFSDSTYIIDSYSVGNIEGHNSVGGLIGNDSLHRVLKKIRVIHIIFLLQGVFQGYLRMAK